MNYKSGLLGKIQRGSLCTGCGACAAVVENVRIERSEEGFNRPNSDSQLSAAEERRIAEVCPGIGLRVKRSKTTNPLWGNMVALRSGHAVKESLRHRSSSGGALSAILIHLIESGAVDFVVHTAADPTDPIANRTVVSFDASDIEHAAGSRYGPSSPLSDVETHLATGKRFAFVGKPCDVAALRAMARTDDRIGANVACMISFFCAGVPSRVGTQKILRRLGVAKNFLKSFKYRGDGWPGATTAVLMDGSRRSMSYRESWGGILSRHVQFRCKICPDGTGNDADIVCADAWFGDEDGYPSFAEASGRSLIVSRTTTGESIVQAAMAAGEVAAEDQVVSELDDMQPGQVKRMRVLLARLTALWITAQPAPVFKGFNLWGIARGASCVSLIRNFLGTGRRVLLGRR